jgi:hypothetical protein
MDGSALSGVQRAELRTLDYGGCADCLKSKATRDVRPLPPIATRREPPSFVPDNVPGHHPDPVSECANARVHRRCIGHPRCSMSGPIPSKLIRVARKVALRL